MDSISREQISHALPVTADPTPTTTTTTSDAPPHSSSNGAPEPTSEPISAPPSTEAPSKPEPNATTTTNGAAAPSEKSNGHTTNGDAAAAPQRAAHRFPTLLGKVALVTGASRGIGAGIALELGSRGASVVVNYVKAHEGALRICAAIEAMNSGGRAVAMQADMSHVPDITRLFEAAKTHYGRIDIVCSNSGMESFDKTAEVTEARFDTVMGLNLRAQFFVGQHAYKYCEEGGRLILMSSIAAGLIGVGDHALYSGSKSAVNGITKSFAKDFGHRGITVNAIAPGGVKSDMFAQVAWKYIPGATGEWSAERIEAAMADHCPLGRCAVPEDVARVVAFLAGEDGGWVNGQIITISGGSGQ
ncbi:MAG: hypothetical protein ALECFALPRED_004814 [Alectoria fallacina]|uniref:Uncharacterized protein n=1 Tax=Alectoria fallacina TaxID=1903189 RepID=A0A8H3ECL3_9LECA|nr:MAG: hypothetical protein ALECFALPRED_004814 [Alectoria fallacina]